MGLGDGVKRPLKSRVVRRSASHDRQMSGLFSIAVTTRSVVPRFFNGLVNFARPRVRHLNVATFRQNVGFFERSTRTLARCGYVSLQAE